MKSLMRWHGVAMVALLGCAAHSGATQDFSIVVLPDSQYYTTNFCVGHGGPATLPNYTQGSNATMFYDQTAWIRSNYPTPAPPAGSIAIPPIAYVAHVGDIVENGDCTAAGGCTRPCADGTNEGVESGPQWTIAATAMHALETSPWIPYGVTVGNHDVTRENDGPSPPNDGTAGTDAATTTNYNKAANFAVSRFSSQAYYGSNYSGSKNNSHYDTFTVGTQKYIVIYMEYDDNTDAMSDGKFETNDPNLIPWAKTLLQNNSDRMGIVVTHFVGSVANPSVLGEQGTNIFNSLKTLSNFTMMIGGHVPGAGRRRDITSGVTGITGNTVNSLIADYQDNSTAGVFDGGGGFLRVYAISNTNNTITAYSYSPYYDSTSNPSPLGIRPTNLIANKTDAHNAFQMQIKWKALLNVYYRNNADNSLGHIYSSGGVWSSPSFISGTSLTSEPAAVSRGPGYSDIFYRGSDGNLKWKAWDNVNGWAAEQSVTVLVGGTPTPIAISGAPAATARGLYRMNVFYKGSGGTLEEVQWDGISWTALASLGGTLTSDPAAVSWNPDRIDVAYLTTGNLIRHRSWNGSVWSAEENLGGPYQGKPSITSSSAYHLDVFAWTTTNAPNHKFFSQNADGSSPVWSGWSAPTATMNSSPSSDSWGPSRVDTVFKSGSQLSDLYWDGSAWNVVSLGGAPNGAPAVTSPSHVF